MLTYEWSLLVKVAAKTGYDPNGENIQSSADKQ